MNSIFFKKIDVTIFDKPTERIVPVRKLQSVEKEIVDECLPLISELHLISLCEDYTVSIPYCGLSQSYCLNEEFGSYESICKDISSYEYEDCEPYYVPRRETHGFHTLVGLIGGGRKGKAKGKQKNKPKKKRTGTVTVIPEGQNSTWNFACISTLTYLDTNIAKTNVGQQYVYWRMRMNDVFDPDPLIASGSLSGFTEMAAQYRRFLVLKLKVNIEIVNNELFPVIVTVAPTDIDQALIITTGAAAINLGEYPLAKSCTLASNTGMNKHSFGFTIHLPSFTGQDDAYKDSLSYSALVNASPTILTFFNIAVSSATNLTVAGVTQRAQYRYRVYWSQRQTPNF